MKILVIAPFIAYDYISQFTRNMTGLGYMIHDITKSLAKTEDVDMFTVTTLTKGQVVEGYHVKEWSWALFFINIKYYYLKLAFQFIRKYKVPFTTKIRELFYICSMGYVEKFINQYDIVQIHGCSPITEAAISCCKRNNVPYVVTLHGLNSFGNPIQLNDSLKQYEKDFLKESYEEKRIVTFVGSGNIKTVCEYLQVKEIPNFKHVFNGCDINIREQKIDIRKKYGISQDSFVFVYVANYSVNKNQIQVARAYNLLSKEFKNKIIILFLGRSYENSDLDFYIKKHNLQKNLILCGSIAKEDVSDYYIAADATILTSIVEGFGLSIIEGYVYGKPCLTFGDLSAVPDLYNPRTMLLSLNREDNTLAKFMEEMVQKDWNQLEIQQYVQNFSLDKMSLKYISIFKDLI